MARLPRLHVPGGFYYVLLRGNGGEPIFHDTEDRYEFSRLVAHALRRSRAHMHAFCWMANHVRFAVQISDVPVGRLVQRIAAQHSRRIHRKLGRSGHLFERGYRALLIDGDKYLTALVRHIHLTPVRSGIVADAADYAWSGHRAYLKLAKVPWLTTNVVLKMLAQGGAGQPLDVYRKFMRDADEREDIARFEHSSTLEPRVLGDERFISSLPLRSRPRRKIGSIDQLIDGVARILEVPRVEMLSASRRRRLSLARALVTWHATHSGIATLTEVARRLDRDPSTLLVAVERYRVQRPDLFTESMAGMVDRDAESWRLLMRRV